MNRGLFGIGSPFGDDQIGWLVVRAALKAGYAERCVLSRIEALDRPGTTLLQHCIGLDTAVVVDAMQSGIAAGTISRFEPDALENSCTGLSCHGWGLSDTLMLGRRLGILPRHTIIYGIEIGSLDTTTTISPAVEDAVPRLLAQLLSDTFLQ